ncbi:MAG: hypothetical protein IJS69_06810 [Selenomonadaceae bacterium]|nr:hypothetical protein [Selenomonadaceae bacterium]
MDRHKFLQAVNLSKLNVLTNVTKIISNASTDIKSNVDFAKLASKRVVI